MRLQCGQGNQIGVLLMQLETPLETVGRAAAVARAAGVTVILNPAPAAKIPRALYRLVDGLMLRKPVLKGE